MLIEFRVGNFRSFNEEQTFSLVASGSKDEKHPNNLIPCDGFDLVKAAAIYGPNASGKSNLIKAISLMEWTIRNSATRMNIGDQIPGAIPFRLHPDSRTQPSLFEAVVITDGTRYEYGFSATAERIHDEWLVVYPPNGKGQHWFERRYDSRTEETAWTFRRMRKTESEMLKEKTRDNCLALSRGAELNIRPLSDLFLWFRRRLWVFDLSIQPMLLIERTAQRVRENPAFGERVVQMIRHADLGIDGFNIAEESLSAARRDLPEAVIKPLMEVVRQLSGKDSLSKLFVKTSHRIPGSDAQELFDLEQDESNGTQRFFALAGPVLRALDNGEVVVVDELDCSMHPLLTRKLIELFQSPEANTKGAQLIFATHDSTLMDPELFRRDQIWLVEKNNRGASELFSLYDFETKDRPRNTEAFERNYLAGRYGGVPKFGPIFEDLVIK